MLSHISRDWYAQEAAEAEERRRAKKAAIGAADSTNIPEKVLEILTGGKL